ncbi:methyltransferase type 11 [Sulfitobacter sp. JL08]|uniref:class I SAM-dependent methyltransferase n=1 Tax=Sulfitobacter sp. JL08 TaxID=2070369 RepID=UPI000E0C81F0|nr:methyltransferase domain-containing protein [Sulfitobacter sp. JL08]AXI54097.1 methyltransferase type 11 [Sulfitobacter sp. JL08]
MPLYVQYGCGHSCPDNWHNYDASPTLRYERLPVVGKLYTRNASRFPDGVRHGDIVTGLPEPRGGVDGIYCSHILEHLALEDCRRALRNTLTLLRPGGVFRMVVPDMGFEARRNLDDPAPDAVSKFMAATYLGQRTRPRGVSGAVKSWLGNSAHLWMWDYKGLASELADASFTDIRRAKVGDATDHGEAFAAVEDAGRWTNALGIECRRPAC